MKNKKALEIIHLIDNNKIPKEASSIYAWGCAEGKYNFSLKLLLMSCRKDEEIKTAKEHARAIK